MRGAKFEKWLPATHESLDALRDDQSRERTLWFCFAHQRAGTVSHEAVGMKRPPTEAHSHYGPPPGDSKRRRTEEPDPAAQANLAVKPSEVPSSVKVDSVKLVAKAQTSAILEQKGDSSSSRAEETEKVAQSATASNAAMLRSLNRTCYIPALREEYLAQRVLTPEAYLHEILELEQKRSPGVLL